MTNREMDAKIWEYLNEHGMSINKTLNICVRDTLCSRCKVLFKRSSVKRLLPYNEFYNSEGPQAQFICRVTCTALIIAPIPVEISVLEAVEMQKLRIVKTFNLGRKPNVFQYQRFRGRCGLSLNLKAWDEYCGLVGLNSTYSQSSPLAFHTPNSARALLWLRENNPIYNTITFNDAVAQVIRPLNQQVYVNRDGFLYFKTRANIMMRNAGREDFAFERVPIAESIESELQTIYNATRLNANVEVLLFPWLFPTGEGHFPFTTSSRIKKLKKMIFNSDERFRKDTEYLFYNFDYIESSRLRFQQHHYLRNNVDPSTVSRNTLLQPSRYTIGQRVIREDITIPLPTSIRGGGGYFKSIRSNLHSFISQKGNPSIFLTFSIDENNCFGLTEYLNAFNTLDFDSTMPNHIQCPVLATHFSYEKLSALIKHLTKKGIGGFQVIHYFVRFEVQKRGTPHCHVLLWTDHLDRNDLLPLITCTVPPIEDFYLHYLVKRYQIHTCSAAYCKKERLTCRFGFPKKPCNISGFLENGSYQIRRLPSESRVNQYNVELIQFLGSNMDISIITSGNYVKYLTKYCTKEESTQMENIAQQNYITNYIRTRDYSINEITFYLTSLKTTMFSGQVVKICACRDLINKRLLKTKKELLDLEEGQDEYFKMNHVNKYENRPPALANLTMNQLFETYAVTEQSYKVRNTPVVVRVYPFYSEYDGELYFAQRVLLHTVYRNAEDLLNGINTTLREFALGNGIEDRHEFDNEPIALNNQIVEAEAEPYIQIRDMFNFHLRGENLENVTVYNLSESQYIAYNAIIAGGSINYIITGGPGTGKSYLIKVLVSMCQSTGRRVTVSGSTGLAAMLIGGVTIHSLLCVAMKNEVWQTLIYNSSHEDKKNYLENLDYLIVDECSMIGQTLFVEIVDIIRDLAPSCRLIFVGDFYQLRPVNDEYLFANESLYNSFTQLRLVESLRVNCPTLRNLLQKFLENDFEYVTDYINAAAVDTVGMDTVHVFGTNTAVSNFNYQCLQRITNANRQIFECEYPESTHNIPDSVESQFRYSRTTHLCIGSRVMLLKNLSTLDGLVNGSIGIVTDKTINPLSNTISSVTVNFVTLTGQCERMISPVTEFVGRYKRKQLPLVLAYALTVHKTQGLTLKSIAVNDIRQFWENSQLYVAISRVRQIGNLEFIKQDRLYCVDDIQYFTLI